MEHRPRGLDAQPARSAIRSVKQMNYHNFPWSISVRIQAPAGIPCCPEHGRSAALQTHAGASDTGHRVRPPRLTLSDTRYLAPRQKSALQPFDETRGPLSHDVTLLVERDHVIAVVEHQRVDQATEMLLQIMGIGE